MPISLPNNGIAVAANTRVYQIRCIEDRRVRYRLRMGPFTSEAQADAVLKVVRDNYPAALTATATGDDLEMLAGLQIEAPRQGVASVKSAAPKLPASAVPQLSISDTVAVTAAAKAPASEPVRKPALQCLAPPAETSSRNRPLVVPTLTATAPAPAAIAAAPVTLQPAPKAAVPPVLQARASVTAAPLTLQAPTKLAMPPTVQAKMPTPAAPAALPPPPKTAAAPAQRAASPMPASPNSLQPASAATLGPAAMARAPATVAAPQPTAAQVAQNFVAAIAAKIATPAPAAVKPQAAPAPSVKPVPMANALKAPISTATVVTASKPAAPAMTVKIDAPVAPVKAATAAVASDSARWFVVELSSSDRPFDPDAVPNLDIFSVYRLYSLESIELGTVTHALRLGFFTEEFAAKAVSDYLADHYEAPVVKRVNSAERERFTERPMEARKTVEATGRHAMIEITDERYVRELRLTTV